MQENNNEFEQSEQAQNPPVDEENEEVISIQPVVIEEEENEQDSTESNTDKEKKPGFFTRILDPNTKIGKILRPALRGLAYAIVLFGLGVFITYFRLVVPANRVIETAQNDVISLSGQIEQLNEDLQSAEDNIDQLTSENVELSDELSDTQLQVEFLEFKNAINITRRAILLEDDGASLEAALAEAKKLYENLQPKLVVINTELAGLIENRLEVVEGEINRDPQQANTDLETLYGNLIEFENDIFP